LLRTVAPRSTTSAIRAVAPPATAAAATILRAVVNEKVKHSDNVRFRIFVEFLNLSSREVLKRYSFQVKSSYTIFILKANIERRTGFSSTKQGIYLNKKELVNDSRTIGYHNIQHVATLRVLPRDDDHLRDLLNLLHDSPITTTSR
jgi:hypothetical protein